MSIVLGHIAGIARFPVKSMRGEPLAEVEVGFQGLPGDRRYAFVQADSRSPFPWLTGREYPQLVRYAPAFEARPGRPGLLVTNPAGVTRPVDSDELRVELEGATGRRLYLLSDHRGNYDIAQLSLVTLATVRAIAAAGGVDPDPARFRMNVVVDTGSERPFTEADWVGRVVILGDGVRVAVTEPDKRCAMVTIDPTTAVAAPAVLKAAADLNGARAGVYGSVTAPGTVRVGDRLVLDG